MGELLFRFCYIFRHCFIHVDLGHRFIDIVHVYVIFSIYQRFIYTVFVLIWNKIEKKRKIVVAEKREKKNCRREERKRREKIRIKRNLVD